MTKKKNQAFVTTDESKIALWNAAMNSNASEAEWNSWSWQEKNRIRSLKELAKILSLSEELKDEIGEVLTHFIMAVTPYYVTHLRQLYDEGKKEHADALSRVFLPSRNEIEPEISPSDSDTGAGGQHLGLALKLKQTMSLDIEDGMGEEGTSPYSYVSQLYPDRALLFVVHHCPFYCRYCFRRRKVILEPKQRKPETILDSGNLDRALNYIKERPAIRDVILSGGEPLSLNDNQLERIISELRKIDHVKILRIDTKMPTVIPMRITPSLVNMLKKYHPIFMTLHFVHPAEITPEVQEACGRLADAGIPLGTYTAIMRGVNDNRDTIKSLLWSLVQMRIRPYYLVQYVPTKWTEHFRVPLQQSMKIIDGLYGELSGLAVPSFKVYVPGKGKVPLLPNYYVERTAEGHLLKTYSGEIALYPEPESQSS